MKRTKQQVALTNRFREFARKLGLNPNPIDPKKVAEIARKMKEAAEKDNQILRSWNLPEINNSEDLYQACIEAGRNPDAEEFGEGGLMGWLIELEKERIIRGIKKPEGGEWIKLLSKSHYTRSESTLWRHARDEEKTHVRTRGDGDYQVRRSEARDWIKPRFHDQYNL